ncbi:Sodium/calcium exchanger protein-domain-containing protein [Polychytrium aggregatum]|uniref:Sodium/calcium exchanger protein-domain-containing protein n=1 Tax=Polychytrium aggregatum TaxID=110093 RepID=UPI0022FE4899|nr:Sodium/calcium exchanger protein-domain-containing protein [Polychytrium aggregatum]KAI9199805.1 Sodium/calcium exchanger protein-domain-containing protein [Polychytrium aggregatum]
MPGQSLLSPTRQRVHYNALRTNETTPLIIPGTFPDATQASEPSWAQSLYIISRSSPINALLLFVPLGLAAGFFEWSGSLVFMFNFLALMPLAKLLGYATEEISLKVGQTIGALLNCTFGNLVELILSVLALKAGLIRVVQASLLGSILSNMLLVLGFCFYCGGWFYHIQQFNVVAAQTAASLLSIVVFSMIIPAAFLQQVVSVPESAQLVLDLSRGTAIVLLVIYILYLYFQLKTHADLYEGDDEDEPASIKFPAAVALLVVVTLLIAGCAEYLVESIEFISKDWKLNQTFVGLILLPIVGNAAEHVTAVTAAVKNKMDLSLGVAIGSSMQIALFVTPICVLAGWLIDQPMSLSFNILETAVIFVSIYVVNSLISDGKSNWLEGAMLLGAYIVISIAFWFLPMTLE